MHIPSRMATFVLAAATLLAPFPVAAQSPSPSPGPSPSATPFPYPTVPPASDVPHGTRLVPRGKPDASVTRHGIRLELWQSSPTVAPGEWVRFAVRTTNLGRDSAWQMSGECLTSGTEMTADLRAVTPPGETWTGNAAAYKERVTKRYATDWIPAWRYLDQLWATATAWAECGVSPGPIELRPGQSRVEHFAWYAGAPLSGERDDLWRPPYPGTLPVAVEWPFLSRGDRPRIENLRRVRTDPIRLEMPLTITGDGPGTPSLDELVDIALSDPAWRAWVEADSDPQGLVPVLREGVLLGGARLSRVLPEHVRPPERHPRARAPAATSRRAQRDIWVGPARPVDRRGDRRAAAGLGRRGGHVGGFVTDRHKHGRASPPLIAGAAVTIVMRS